MSKNSKLYKVVDKTEYYGYNNIYYSYDAAGNVIKEENGTILQRENHITRDKYNRVVETYNKYELHDQRLNYTYTDNFSERLESESYSGTLSGTEYYGLTTNYDYDALKRPTRITVKDKYNNGYRQEITYLTKGYRESMSGRPIGPTPSEPPYVATGETNIIDEVKTYGIVSGTETLEKTEKLSYDPNGNITRYGDNTYEYDGIGRLTRENNADLNKSFTYEYDSRGNVISKKTYAYTTGTLGDATATQNYTYDGYDRLTNTGYVYDNLGNPTSYNGKTLTWERGKLKTAVVGNKTLTYTYDGYGRQVKKQTKGSGISTINQTIAYDNYNRLLETQDNNGRLTFIYNSQGVVGCYYDGILYTYRKNLFGDITAIYQGATCVAKYKYDAWGNCTVCNPDGTENTSASFIGNINPFRYRGYYWDKDLQLYNLQTRWYDPIIGRFIQTADISSLNPQAINGLNLYSFARNNPIVSTYKTNNGKIDTTNNTYLQFSSEKSFVNRTHFNNFSFLSEPLIFNVGMVTPGTHNLPKGMELSAIYINGHLGFGFGYGKNYGQKESFGLSFASLNLGIASLKHDVFTFDKDSSLYLGVGTLNANASLGLGLTGSLEIFSFYFGAKFNNYISLDGKVYVGWGLSLDFSKGIKIGIAIGLGFEISLNF